MENINQIVCLALKQPAYARTEYLKIKQKESGYTETVFAQMLLDSIKFLQQELHKHDWRFISPSPQVYLDISLYTDPPAQGLFLEGALIALLDNIEEAFLAKQVASETTPTNDVEVDRFRTIFKSDDDFLLPKKKEEKIKYKQKGKITQYETIYAHYFKAKAGIEKLKGSGDWRREGGQAMKAAYYTTDKTHENYSEPDDKNINNILFLLNDFPKAQVIAEKELDPL